MPDDTATPFLFPAVSRKKVTAAFDGGRMTSDGGVMLLAAAERRLGVAGRQAPQIADPRNPALVTHSVADILRARMLAIACGWEDADDLDHLRTDPGFKLACGRSPDSGRDLCSQPTVSRWENAPSLREVVRLTYAMVDLYCASYPKPPGAVTLDIDDTVDIVHGHQQLSLFNAHHDERCFMPIHVYDIATSRPVAIVLRPGRTPSGLELRGHVRRLVRRKGDDLERIAGVVDFEMFRAELDQAVPRSDGSIGGGPAFDRVLMFKVLLLQAMHSLSDKRCEYLIKDRLSFMRFLGVGLADPVPDANTIWTFREALKRAGAAVTPPTPRSGTRPAHIREVVPRGQQQRRDQREGRHASSRLAAARTPTSNRSSSVQSTSWATSSSDVPPWGWPRWPAVPDRSGAAPSLPPAMLGASESENARRP